MSIAQVAVEAAVAARKVRRAPVPVVTLPFVADARAVARAVGEIARVAERKASFPVLGTVRVEVLQGRVTFTATDLTRILTTSVEGEGAAFAPVLVRADLLAAALRGARKGERVEFARDGAGDNRPLVVTVAGRIARLPSAVSAKDFPKVDYELAAGAATFSSSDGAALRDALQYAACAASKDENRPHLSGVRFDLWGDNQAGWPAFVATDGHRLHAARAPLAADRKLAKSPLVPTAAVETLARLLPAGPVTVRCDGARLEFRADGIAFSAKLLDAAFPPWDQVVPRRGYDDRAEFAVGAEQVAGWRNLGFDSRGRRGIALTLVGRTLTARMDSSDDGERSATATVRNTSGRVGRIGVDSALLADACDGIEGDVTVSMGHEQDPIRLDADGRLAVVMPMRI